MIPAPDFKKRRELERDQRRQPGRGNGVATLLLLIGVAGLILSLGMDTSVETGLGRVNNIGLMKDQQNYLMVSGLITLIGIILLLRRKPQDGELEGSKVCPECAETIKARAKVCRFCGYRNENGLGQTEVDPAPK